MNTEWSDLPELKEFGVALVRARLDRGISQGLLAKQCKLTQAQVSLFETGRRLPSLDQFIRLARALDVPLQRLLTGGDHPGVELKDLVVELRRLGAVDLWVAGAVVPGSARCPEEVIALAVSGNAPDPRIVEALPALLSWNEIRPALLRAYGVVTRTIYRLAWLSDIALTIERQKGFPGGCRKDPLGKFLKAVGLPKERAWDNLGKAGDSPPKYPVWRRWKISYPATLEQFEDRARGLSSLSQHDRYKIIRIGSRVRVLRVPHSPQKVAPGGIVAKARRPQKEQKDGR